MPNWCSNKATITAVSEEAKQLLSNFREHISIHGNSKLFNFFIPIPEDLNIVAGSLSGIDGEKLKKKGQENIEKYGYENWYEFSIAKWGTKWDLDIHQHNLCDNAIIIDQDTAWSPPIEFYRHMEDIGFEVEASYCEPGAGFCGTYSGGYDNNIDIPHMVGVGQKVFDVLNNYSKGFKLINFDINNIKVGDILTTECGESFMYLSHKVHTVQDILEENPKINNKLLCELEAAYKEIINMKQDIYVITLNRDQSIPGEEIGIVLSDDMSLLYLSEY